MFVGKAYKRKNDPASPRFIVIDQQGDFLTFESGERCKTTTLMDQFNEDYIDPAFFWAPKPSLLAAAIINGPIEMMAESDAPDAPPVRRIEAGVGEVNPISHAPLPKVKSYAPQQDPYAFPDSDDEDDSRFDFPDEDAAPAPVKRSRDKVEAIVPPVVVEEPEVAIFRRIRMSNTAVIDLKLGVKMPEKDQARVLDTMFETSLVDFLAEDYMRQLVENADDIKEQIREQVQIYIYGAPKKPKPKAKELVPVEIKKSRSGARKKGTTTNTETTDNEIK